MMIWCSVSVRCLCNFIRCGAQVSFIQRKASTRKKYRWYIINWIPPVLYTCVRFILLCQWQTFKTFVIFLNVFVMGAWATQQFMWINVFVCDWNATLENIFAAINHLFPHAIVQVNHWLGCISNILKHSNFHLFAQIDDDRAVLVWDTRCTLHTRCEWVAVSVYWLCKVFRMQFS